MELLNKHSFIALITALGLSSGNLPAAQNVFKPGAKDLGRSTSCAPAKWANEFQNSCMCCVIKHTPKATVTPAGAASILKTCDKYCGSQVSTQIAAKLNVKLTPPATGQKAFVDAINKNFAGLQFVDLKPYGARAVDAQGNLTVDGVSVVLDAAGLGAGFEVEKIGGGGANTLQLFLIKKDGQLKYVLKGLKKAIDEVRNLEIIRKSPMSKLIKNPADPAERGMPILAMDEANLTYLDAKGGEHNVAIINAAQGKAISDIIFSWTKPKPDRTRASEGDIWDALYRMGHNIALIHEEFMKPAGNIAGKTYAHGDMHPYNVFYDAKNDRIVFIDNESFAISIQSARDISVDIMKFYGRLVASGNKAHHAYRQGGITEKQFYEVVVKPFVLGYIDGFAPPPEDTDSQQVKLAKNAARDKVFQRLYNIITSQGALKTWLENNKTDLNPLVLYRSQQNFAKPMFLELSREYGFSMGSASGKTSLLGRLVR